MHDGDRSNEPATLGAFGYFSAIVLCCLIVGGLTYDLGRENERRYETPASYAKAAKADAQSACVGREGSAAFECIYEKVEAAQEQARGEQDLSAQQKAANSALISALVAFATLILTGVGVWYVKRTLEATLKAVEDTGKATSAMERQNEIAIKSMGTSRAWITPTGINYHFLDSCTVDGVFIGNTIAVNANWINSGGSPAIKCAVIRAYKMFPIGTPKDRQIVPIEMPRFDDMSTVVGPNQNISATHVFLTAEEARAFRNRECIWVIASQVIYYDVFSDASDPTAMRSTYVTYVIEHGGGTMIEPSGKRVEALTITMNGQNYAT